MLHCLAELDVPVRVVYAVFDYKRILAALNAFMTVDFSAFYFNVRKDALYCAPDPPISSLSRRACLTVLDQLFRCTVIWVGATVVLYGGGSLAGPLPLRRGFDPS